MTIRNALFTLIFATFAAAPLAIAKEDPREKRQELMESVRDAAKPVGKMLKGDTEFDADVIMASLSTWEQVSAVFGDHFPEGTETGMETEAAPAIWEDREGFEQARADWRNAVLLAIDAAPQTLDEARTTVGPIFNECKNCHDNYRIEE
ncbi:MAG: cytochrome c [Gammaproteobacteria bacterium]|nr:cytochrome c [Gammaproteobacteria bacterium]